MRKINLVPPPCLSPPDNRLRVVQRQTDIDIHILLSALIPPERAVVLQGEGEGLSGALVGAPRDGVEGAGGQAAEFVAFLYGPFGLAGGAAGGASSTYKRVRKWFNGFAIIIKIIIVLQSQQVTFEFRSHFALPYK